MKKKYLMGKSIVIYLVLSLIFIQPAYAYLDPGAGSAILQGIIAAVVAIGIVLKLYWHKFLKLFGLRKDKDLDKKEINDKS